MPFNIIRADITSLDVDAIVNAANSRLQAGGGVCGAIFSAAEKAELQAACDKIGYCGIGEAVITKGFKLKAKYIIHTVGPIYGQNPAEEEQQLYSCYKNSLELAEKMHLGSIAFPLISSGIYGYPKAEALKIATRAITDFLPGSDMQVVLVVYDRKAFQISGKLFAEVESFIDERMVKPESRRSADLRLSEDIEYAAASMPMAKQIAIPDGAPLRPQLSLEELLHQKVETFSDMLFRLIDERGMTDVEVYKRANIDRKLFSKMRKKDYAPKKATVLALIIALGLDMGEARQLLGRAGYAFTESSKLDIIIEFFIENKKYDIFEINETLFAFDQPILGS
ncbi:MAG: macro domain-containing protein [Oscillospiraceae bacterium]|nr:macro domain-containing protein [Oscillospiraceae bacterium]